MTTTPQPITTHRTTTAAPVAAHVTEPRAASPTAQRSGGRARMVGQQIRAELVQNLRSPGHLIGTVLVPVILYGMFAIPTLGQKLDGGTDAAAMLIASFGAYGVVSLCIFSFGVDIAQERERGWLRRLRSTPMPMWVFFVGKLVMALVFSALIVGLIVAVALVAGVPMEAGRVSRTVGMLLAGTLIFAPLGCALAFLAPPKAAAALGNLVFLPLSFCSGFFTPLSSLPHALQQLAPWLPTYHFGRLVWSQIGPAQDVAWFTGEPVGGLGVNMAVVIAAAIVGLALATCGFVRDGHRERS